MGQSWTVDRGLDAMSAMVPALLFLCAGVPLAALLDDLGYFHALAIVVTRRWQPLPVAALWWLAAATTVVLNLDTTIVLLTPLYLRLSRRAGVDPVPVVLIPLLLASFASAVLPVSNLTTLIASGHYHLGVGEVLGHLAPASGAACVVGWLFYRRRYPTLLSDAAPDRDPDRRVLWIGSAVVVGLLVGFVVGPVFDIAPWMVAVATDAVLAVVVRRLPWRELPLATAAGVAVVGGLLGALVPAAWFEFVGHASGAGPVGGLVLLGAAVANLTNNLPAVLVVVDANRHVSPGVWAWLAGANIGAVIGPVGALASLLWSRILRREGLAPSVRQHVALVVPIAVPALVAAAVTMGLLSRIL